MDEKENLLLDTNEDIKNLIEINRVFVNTSGLLVKKHKISLQELYKRFVQMNQIFVNLSSKLLREASISINKIESLRLENDTLKSENTIILNNMTILRQAISQRTSQLESGNFR